jgi:bifunctional DNA-binding transcriptional regulator/antitoxin component of YhaV-PrlF toxin-antitoxin module
VPAQGIVRKLDSLGRIVLPIDIRRRWGLERKGDDAYVLISVEDDKLVLSPAEDPRCPHCGELL